MQPAAQPAIQDAMADEKPAREEPEPLKHQSDPGAITSKCWKITNDILSLSCWYSPPRSQLCSSFRKFCELKEKRYSESN